MNRLLILLLVIILFPLHTFAQESEVEKKNIQLGLALSTMGGSGIYYLAKPTLHDHFKFTGIFIYDTENENKDSYFSLGAEYQRNLFVNQVNRSYSIVGFSFDNSISGETFFDESNSDRIFNAGVGMGIDFGNPDKGIILNLHITYQYTSEFGENEFNRLGLGGGFGIGLNF